MRNAELVGGWVEMLLSSNFLLQVKAQFFKF